MDRQDPWYFQRWAFRTSVGNPVRKAVLSMLAMMADAQTGRCEAKQETLAEGVEAGERAVRGHLKALEERGLIARRPQFRRDRGRRGDEFLLLAPGITEWPDGEPVGVQPAPDAAGGSGTDGQDPPAQDDLFNRHRSTPQERPLGTASSNDHASQPDRTARARGDDKPDPKRSPPDDFPDELREHARQVYALLQSVAAQHGAKEVTPLALGRVLMARPRKPLVRAAHDFAAWAADPPRPIRDVVASYRRWLDDSRTPTLAAIEQLGADGLPVEAAGGGARPAPRGGSSNADKVEASIRALRNASA